MYMRVASTRRMFARSRCDCVRAVQRSEVMSQKGPQSPKISAEQFVARLNSLTRANRALRRLQTAFLKQNKDLSGGLSRDSLRAQS